MSNPFNEPVTQTQMTQATTSVPANRPVPAVLLAEICTDLAVLIDQLNQKIDAREDVQQVTFNSQHTMTNPETVKLRNTMKATEDAIVSNSTAWKHIQIAYQSTAIALNFFGIQHNLVSEAGSLTEGLELLKVMLNRTRKASNAEIGQFRKSVQDCNGQLSLLETALLPVLDELKDFWLLGKVLLTEVNNTTKAPLEAKEAPRAVLEASLSSIDAALKTIDVGLEAIWTAQAVVKAALDL